MNAGQTGQVPLEHEAHTLPTSVTGNQYINLFVHQPEGYRNSLRQQLHPGRQNVLDTYPDQVSLTLRQGATILLRPSFKVFAGIMHVRRCLTLLLPTGLGMSTEYQHASPSSCSESVSAVIVTNPTSNTGCSRTVAVGRWPRSVAPPFPEYLPFPDVSPPRQPGPIAPAVATLGAPPRPGYYRLEKSQSFVYQLSSTGDKTAAPRIASP